MGMGFGYAFNTSLSSLGLPGIFGALGKTREQSGIMMMDRDPREDETNSGRASGIYGLRIYLTNSLLNLILLHLYAFLFFLCFWTMEDKH